MCAAAILFSLVGANSGYGALVPGMVVLGVGIGSFYPTATTAGVTSVEESQTSLAGGIVYMFQIAGGSIGLGLTTTVFSANIPPFIDGFQAGFRLGRRDRPGRGRDQPAVRRRGVGAEASRRARLAIR